jgi:hypothetical protein
MFTVQTPHDFESFHIHASSYNKANSIHETKIHARSLVYATEASTVTRILQFSFQICTQLYNIPPTPAIVGFIPVD